MYSDNLGEITDAVYAMGTAIASSLGTWARSPRGLRKPKEDGDRRERKLQAQIKALRQKIASVSNELHCRKTGRKATNREQRIMKVIRKQV